MADVTLTQAQADLIVAQFSTARTKLLPKDRGLIDSGLKILQDALAKVRSNAPGGITIPKTPARSVRSGLPFPFGAYSENGKGAPGVGAGMDALEKHFGPLDVTVAFHSQESWGKLTEYIDKSAVDRPGLALLSYPLLPAAADNGSKPVAGVSLEAAARGDYDSIWESFGRYLVKQGLNTYEVILRIGWEFNGTWYAWSNRNQSAAYAAAYERCVRSIKRGIGADVQLRFDWCCNLGASGGTFIEIAPDTYDIISIDCYDFLHSASIAEWAANVERRMPGPSLTSVLEIAHRNHKQVGIPEFNGDGRDDLTVHVEQMVRWCAQHAADIAYLCYFDGGTDKKQHSFTGMPRNAAAIKRALDALR